ncbi:MAG: exopolysaccharide biosynthesis polyprenyl glycosylphosphotransferase [Chthoniobacteraceae bacterium]|jgi:putative colanic acid biosynthesis UDP-glucose lipid carrier transferase
MISHRIRGVEALFVALQAAAVILLYWGWFTALSHLSSAYRGVDIARYNSYCLTLVVGLLAGNLVARPGSVREALYERSFLDRLPFVLRQTTWSVGCLLLYLFITKESGHISRFFLMSFVPALYLALLWTDCTLPGALVWLSFREPRQENTLLVGSCQRVTRLAPWLQRKARFGLRTVGVLCDEAHAHCSPAQCPVLGGSADLPRVMGTHRVSQVVLIEFREDSAALVEPIQRSGARLLILSDLAERLGHSISLFEDDGLHFFSLHQEPLENPVNRMMKRGMDVLVSLLVVGLVLPVLMVIVWICQRLESPGPLFFRQARAGIQNREFMIWKFRTMRPGAGEESERIFPAGRWLRRYSIDEFPQFINVLRGDMSVIGPRPHMVEHNAQFAQVMSSFHIRAFVKPGITGLAQVQGFRGEARRVEDVAHRLESDMIYLENWSPLLDFVILLRTVWEVVFPADGAR